MEPLKQSRKDEILNGSPGATSSDIAEYEKLLAERFTVDPDVARNPNSQGLADAKSSRLKQLRQKLFPESETAGQSSVNR